MLVTTTKTDFVVHINNRCISTPRRILVAVAFLVAPLSEHLTGEIAALLGFFEFVHNAKRREKLC
jgi:hypothetical protein